MKFLRVFSLAVLGMLLASCGRSPDRSVRRGTAALDAGDPAGAIRHLERALTRLPEEPGTAPVRATLALARARAGDTAGAEEDFRAASALDPDAYLLHLNYGALLLELGRPAEALDPLTHAIRANGSRTEALELMAEAARRMNDRPLAQRMLAEASLRTDSPRVLTSLATLSGDPALQRELLRQALEMNAGYAPALYNTAVVLDRSGGDPSLAIRYYARYLTAEPDGAGAEAVRARMRQLERRLEQPLPAHADPVARQVQDLLLQTGRARGRGDTLLALNLSTRAAQLAARADRSDLQERALRAGVEAAPSQARAHAALGEFLLGEGRIQQALDAYREAVRLAPEAFPAQMGLARAALAGKQNRDARSALEAAESLAPTAAALGEIAGLHRDPLGDRAAARRVERLLRERFPDAELRP